MFRQPITESLKTETDNPGRTGKTDCPCTDITEQGMAERKKSTNYHQRSVAENAMYRFKQLFGGAWPRRILNSK